MARKKRPTKTLRNTYKKKQSKTLKSNSKNPVTTANRTYKDSVYRPVLQRCDSRRKSQKPLQCITSRRSADWTGCDWEEKTGKCILQFTAQWYNRTFQAKSHCIGRASEHNQQ